MKIQLDEIELHRRSGKILLSVKFNFITFTQYIPQDATPKRFIRELQELVESIQDSIDQGDFE